MSKSICVHCTEPELETREKRRALFGFVGRDVENAQHIEMDTSAGIKEGTINDLNAAKVSAMKAAEIGECCLSLLSSLFFSSVVALPQGFAYSSAGSVSSSALCLKFIAY